MSVYSDEVTIELLRLQPPKPQSTRQKFLKLYYKGLNDYEIAEKLAAAETTIRRWREELGLPLNSKRKRRR